ncbi:hypothetical protein XENOCAPTIV_009632 [Xenoophorus captivus]|uniref:Dehydrogenase/reductase SDR family member 7B n=1 Tax=Xenoophorus captivus TaxID=1517983 RepID=A0ABV0S1Z6_9TELE
MCHPLVVCDAMLFYANTFYFVLILGLEKPTFTPNTVVFNLVRADSVEKAAQEILKCYGHIDVLINNAGISYRGNILDTHIAVQRDVMETNYFGPIALTQASKHATQAYFDCLRAEIGHLGIPVTVISPGYIRTNLSVNAVTGDGSKYGGWDPRDVADAVLKAVRQKSKDVVLAGTVPTVAIYLRTLWPALFFKLMSSRARKEQKHKDE